MLDKIIEQEGNAMAEEGNEGTGDDSYNYKSPRFNNKEPINNKEPPPNTWEERAKKKAEEAKHKEDTRAEGYTNQEELKAYIDSIQNKQEKFNTTMGESVMSLAKMSDKLSDKINIELEKMNQAYKKKMETMNATMAKIQLENQEMKETLEKVLKNTTRSE